MVAPCDLEVDINGEELFLVDKEILSSFSGRLSKLFITSSVSVTKTLKVIFHDFPGGAEAFELMTRFCYNKGKAQMIPTNTCLLHCVGHYMEIAELIEMAEKSLEGISCWPWPEILNALKQCQDHFPMASSSEIFKKVLNSLIGRIVAASDTNHSGSSPESAGAVRCSCDTKSTMSTKTSCQRVWWFEDLVVLNSETIEKLIRGLIDRKLDHVTISKFLFYYIKCKSSNTTSDEKRKYTELVIDMLYSLDRNSVSCKGLFGILRLSSSLNLSKCCRSKLESMIGSQIDQAKLDNLLVPAANGTNSLYDVNLVLRFLKSFLDGGGRTSITRLKEVGSLMDLYIAEVAPDSCLKPSKFVALTTALPDAARDSHDAIYRAIDMYLEVHTRLSAEEKMKICCSINFEKLSSESCNHLAHNSKFPSRTAIQALISQQSKLRSLLQDTNRIRSFGNGWCKGNKRDDGEQIILHAKKLDLSIENEKLKAHLQGMQWRVMELEKVCRKMQSQVAKIPKSKTSIASCSRSLPRLCS